VGKLHDGTALLSDRVSRQRAVPDRKAQERQQKVWRKDRIAHCIATLLRDRDVAQAVARSINAKREAPEAPEVTNEDLSEAARRREHWLGSRVLHGRL
jgi:hypothetical protein